MKKHAKESKKKEKFIILPSGRKIRIGPDTVPATGKSASPEEFSRMVKWASKIGVFEDNILHE